MKKTLIVAAMLASLGAYAQGTVNFANIVISGGTRVVDAPVFDVDGTTKLSGSGFQAQLVAGPNSGSMAVIGTPTGFLTGGGAGYFSGGPRTIDTVTPGNNATLAVQAWNTASGASYAAATTKGQGASLTIATGGAGSPPSLPANLVGLQSFSLTTIPEPSTIALGALGLAALLIRRRK